LKRDLPYVALFKPPSRILHKIHSSILLFLATPFQAWLPALPVYPIPTTPSQAWLEQGKEMGEGKKRGEG